MRVAQSASYKVRNVLWRRRVASGTIRCELLGGIEHPARRPVQLVAEYEDGDTTCTRIRRCESPEEEREAAIYLEQVIRAASRRPAA